MLWLGWSFFGMTGEACAQDGHFAVPTNMGGIRTPETSQVLPSPMERLAKPSTGSQGTKKSKASQPVKKKVTTSKKKTTASKNAKKKPAKDVRHPAAEKESAAAMPEFSREEIEHYRDMPYQTWDSPREVSDLGLPIMPGFAQPYPYGNLMRQFCGGTKRKLHRGHDIGIVGEDNGGLGTVINAVTRSVVTFVGRTGQDEGEFGKLDKRGGETVRTGRKYRRQILVPGYGLVYPFSLNYGRWRSGMVIVTKVLDGPLKDYTIRYMHMGDIRHDLKPGDVVEAGEHIAIMGGTAVLDSFPHVHIDLATPSGVRADLAPYIGISKTIGECRAARISAKQDILGTDSKAKAEKNDKKKATNKSRNATKKVTPKKRSRSVYIGRIASAEKPVVRVLARNS